VIVENNAILNTLPIDRAVCFSNEKGEPSEKAQKQQTKLLFKLWPFTKRFMESEERLLFAVSAIAPMSKLDMFFKGWHVYYLKSCALVFTDRRILYMPTSTNGKPKQSLAQIRYGDIVNYTIKGILNGAFEIVYKNGRKENFTINTTGDFKKMRSFLPRYIPGGQTTDKRERHSLCPRCTKPLVKDNYSCPSCHFKFKTPSDLIKKAILIPGGGYFLTGHFWFGMQGALAEIVLLIILLSTLVAAHGKAELMPASVVFLIVIVLNKLLVIEHVKYFAQQYMPLDKNPLENRQS
jgi:hypothetical protein